MDGTAKIGDFGLAVATDRSRLTQEGMMVGKPSYMPSEHAMGGEVTPRSDLYCLGAMLYEMVTNVVVGQSVLKGRLHPHVAQLDNGGVQVLQRLGGEQRPSFP